MEQSRGLVNILTDIESNIQAVIEVEKGLTVAKTLEGSPLCMQIKEHGRAKVATSLDLQLVRLAAMMNVKHNLTNAMITTIVYDLLEKYPNETMEDFMLVFKRMRQGYYGPSYHMLSEATIMECMDLHLDEKWAEKERQLAKEKEASYDADQKTKEEIEAAELEILKAYAKMKKDVMNGEPIPAPAPVQPTEDERYNQFKANFIKERILKQNQVESQKELLNQLEDKDNQIPNGDQTEGRTEAN